MPRSVNRLVTHDPMTTPAHRLIYAVALLAATLCESQVLGSTDSSVLKQVHPMRNAARVLDAPGERRALGSSDLALHGGPVMKGPIRLYIIYYGERVAVSPANDDVFTVLAAQCVATLICFDPEMLGLVLESIDV